MSVPVFDPFADLTRLRHQFEKMVDETHGNRAQDSSRLWRPAVDVFESEDAVTVRLDLPGLDRQKLDVQLTGEELVIRGERKWVTPEKSTVLHAERPHGQFHRVFRVGIPLQHDGVEATYQDGVLAVRLPKADVFKPRRIEVKVGEDG